jgi:hypothetical protein
VVRFYRGWPRIAVLNGGKGSSTIGFWTHIIAVTMVHALPLLLRTTFAMVFGGRWMELATQFSGQPLDSKPGARRLPIVKNSIFVFRSQVALEI